MNEFLIKIGFTFMTAWGVMYILNRLQKKKERDAARMFELTLKARGMVDHILPPIPKEDAVTKNYIDPFKTVKTREELDTLESADSFDVPVFEEEPPKRYGKPKKKKTSKRRGKRDSKTKKR